MKLKNRLSLYSVAIFSVIILVLCAVIYGSYYKQIELREKNSLHSKNLLAAIYYLEKDESSLQEHEYIKNQLLKTISKKNVLILNTSYKRYNGEMDRNPKISDAFLKEVKNSERAFLNADQYFYSGLFYRDNEGDFFVISRESKEEFQAQMNTLLGILITVFLLTIIFVFFFSRYLGFIAYEPINSIISQLKNRSQLNFNEPIKLKKSYTEIEELAKEYNYFVHELNRSFQIQKNFIDYVSHELRTPIAALYGTLEVASLAKRDSEYYENALPKLKSYTKDLEDTLDQMMLLSGTQNELDFVQVRLDEVVFDVTEQLILVHQAKINIKIEVENYQHLTINGDSKLLKLAFKNIIQNAVKYSSNAPVDIILSDNGENIQVQITDSGIGIPNEEIEKISQNFYRANNSKEFEGKGIGLSLAQIIFKLHHANLIINSKVGETVVKILF